jgi:hypothetical protein
MDTAPAHPRPESLLRSLALDVGLPWLAVQLMEHVWQMPMVPALAVAAVFPAASIVFAWVQRGRLDFIGIAVLATILCGIAVALSTNDPRFAVLKGAPGFGLFGIACLFSLGRPRPLMFFIGREFTARGDPEKAAEWTARLDNPGFRRAMRRLTLVWGAAALAEATLGIAAVLLLPPAAALLVEPMLGIGTISGLLAWTTMFARRRSPPRMAAA